MIKSMAVVVLGINETVERNLHSRFSIKMHELYDREKLIEKLHAIQKTWVNTRFSHFRNQGNFRGMAAAVGILRGIMNYFLSEVDFFISKCDRRE